MCFFLPDRRWQITYGGFRTPLPVVACTCTCGSVSGLGGGVRGSPALLGPPPRAGAGQIINTATFIVDSYTKHDTMDMLAQANSGGGRSAYSGTLQFLRIR